MNELIQNASSLNLKEVEPRLATRTSMIGAFCSLVEWPLLLRLVLIFLGAWRIIQDYVVSPRVMGKNMDEPDPDILDKTYRTWREIAPFETSLRPTLEGLQAMIDFLADSVPGAKHCRLGGGHQGAIDLAIVEI